ncbi:MAG: V-type ATPase subunit [Nanoarchaeota archaeon]|nr:V-type ATPase subunit [Nanoarchaeota archaeon]
MFGNKIWLRESPYTAVRTRVMRTLLIPREDYSKLMKMSLSEISNYLAESTYRQEINEYGVKYSGIELLEQALPLNLRRAVEKLKRISPDSYNSMIDAYILKYDVDNLKTLIRAKLAGLPVAEARRLIVGVGRIRGDLSVQMFSQPTIDDMLAFLPADLAPFMEAYGALQEKTIAEIENALDRTYFDTIFAFTEKIPRQGKLFARFLLSQVHHINVLTFLRLRKELPKEELQKLLILPRKDPHTPYFAKLYALEQDADILAHLAKRYPEIKDLSSLIGVELALQSNLFRKTLRFEHQDPMSIYAILSYLFAKEIEIQNIKKIVKAKHLGIDMSLIAPLVIA